MGAQTNYLGPYLLTRLLEGRLRAGAASRSGPAKVVNVSSIMHRVGVLKNSARFLAETYHPR